MTAGSQPFRTIILAGERAGGSSLACEFGVTAGVMVPVAGKPLLERVLQAIEASTMAEGGIVCGPTQAVVNSDPALQKLLQNHVFQRLEPAVGPASSALASVQALDHTPVLLTTGDHALLTPEIVDSFCRQSLAPGGRADIIIGLVPYALVKAAWPESRRTVLKFAGGGYCGANLFAVMSPRGSKALEFWQRLENDRKHPWRIARRLGVTALLRYLFRRATLEDALDLLSEKTGCRIGHVLLDDPRAAVDVDTAADQRLAEKILSTI